MIKIAEWMKLAIDHCSNNGELAKLRREVKDFCQTLRDI